MALRKWISTGARDLIEEDPQFAFREYAPRRVEIAMRETVPNRRLFVRGSLLHLVLCVLHYSDAMTTECW